MEWLEKDAVIDNLDMFIGFVMNHVHQDLEPSGKLEMEIRLICEESMINTINYAYGDNIGKLRVGYEFDPKSQMITLMVIDQGIAFDPTKKEDPDINEHIMERKIGGLGIFMVKNLSDSVTYTRDNGNNILEIKKTVD